MMGECNCACMLDGVPLAVLVFFFQRPVFPLFPLPLPRFLSTSWFVSVPRVVRMPVCVCVFSFGSVS